MNPRPMRLRITHAFRSMVIIVKLPQQHQTNIQLCDSWKCSCINRPKPPPKETLKIPDSESDSDHQTSIQKRFHVTEHRRQGKPFTHQKCTTESTNNNTNPTAKQMPTETHYSDKKHIIRIKMNNEKKQRTLDLMENK